MSAYSSLKKWSDIMIIIDEASCSMREARGNFVTWACNHDNIHDVARVYPLHLSK